jgi:hypothetical protein
VALAKLPETAARYAEPLGETVYGFGPDEIVKLPTGKLCVLCHVYPFD